MNIIIFYLPEYFNENRGQVAYYIGSRREKFFSFITNVEAVADIKRTVSQIYINWRQSGSPEDCFWVPILYQIMKKPVRKADRKFNVKKGACGFKNIDGKIELNFKNQLPTKSFNFNL
jgi:hypothetical protein